MNNGKSRANSSRLYLLLDTLEQVLAIDAVEMQPALDEAAQLLSRALNVEKIDIFSYDSASHSLLALGMSDSPMSKRQKELGLDRLPIVNGGHAAGVFLTGDPFISGRIDQDERELPGMRTPWPQGLGTMSAIISSIPVQGEQRGVVVAASRERDFFTEQDLHFLKAAGHWIGAVMHRAELVEKRTEEAAEQGRRIAAEELLTVLAHDLKNYLTPLRARMNLLERRTRREQRSEELHHVHAATTTIDRLNALINDLLDVARVDQGLFTLSFQTFNLTNLIQETVSAFRTPESPIDVFAPDEIIITADAGRLRQLLENLLANAVKHASKGTKIIVRAHKELREDGEWANASVWNQGPVIPDDLLAHLFQPFETGENSRGLGLGLFLARSIAEAHHGQLTVSTSEEQGTQFTLVLPLTQIGIDKDEGA